MPTFAIADCPPRLALTPTEKDGKAVQTGAISLTVRNTSERALSGRVQLRPQTDAKPSWFAIAGAAATSPIEIEQDFAGKGTRTITVTVTVDAGDRGGSYLFSVRATSELDPDNDFVDGPAIAFEVPKVEPKPPTKSFPWWAVAAAVVLMAVVGGAFGFLAFRHQLPTEAELVGLPKDKAKEALARGGFDGAINMTSGPPQPDVGIDPGEVQEAKYAADGKSIALAVAGIEIPGRLDMSLTELRDVLGNQFKPRMKDGHPADDEIDDQHSLWRVVDTQPKLGEFAEPGTEILLTVGVTIPDSYEHEKVNVVSEELKRHHVELQVSGVPDEGPPNDSWVIASWKEPLPQTVSYGASVGASIGASVPNLLGDPLREATQDLDDLRLVTTFSDDSQVCKKNPHSAVYAQTPAPDFNPLGAHTPLISPLGTTIELSCIPRAVSKDRLRRPLPPSMSQVVLVVKHSGKCAQVDGASRDDGANISQWDCVDQDNVKWLKVTREDGLVAFLNMASIKVMQVDGASVESGANVSQWEARPDQQGGLWRPEDAGDGLVFLVNGSSEKCLGVADGSDENGGNIVQLDCAREENMEWQIQELPAVQ